MTGVKSTVKSNIKAVFQSRGAKRYHELRRRAEACLDMAADALGDIGDASLYYAEQPYPWQEGPEGRLYCQTLNELREAADALRRITLPDVSHLR